MPITKIKDLIKHRNTIYNELKKELEHLERLERLPLHYQEKDNTRVRIRDLEDELDCIRDFLRKTATFKTKEFVDFMTKFLVLTEGDYKSTEITLLEDIPTGRGPIYEKFSRRNYKDMTRDMSGKKVYFISDDTTSEYLEDNIYTEDDLNRYLILAKTDDVTYFEDGKYHPFNDNFSVKKEIASHPRLKTAIYELIQLRMDNADLTDKERFETVLENTIIRNYKRSNTSYEKKKGSIF